MNLATAFEATQTDGAALLLRCLCDFVISSGRLVACDPMEGGQPFKRRVPNGRHPVEVLVMKYDTGDERVALARVTFAKTPVARWEFADGYAVGSGTGSFADGAFPEPDAAFNDRIFDESKRTGVHTWAWTHLTRGTLNIVTFSSGIGDGDYASYFGLGPKGDVVSLVTDFEILDDLDVPHP